jgi:hypothetical protein
MSIKTKIITFLILFFYSSLFSQDNQIINNIIKDINTELNPNIELDANKGALVFSVFENGDLKRESTIFIEEVYIEKIAYSLESIYITIPCYAEDCAMQKLFGNRKVKKYTSQIRLIIADTLKGKKTENLLKILLTEMNTEKIVRLKSESNFINLSPHMVSIMVDQLFYLNLGLSYEYIIKKERLGYKTFLIYSPKYKSTETGLALKIYLGQNKANIYTLGNVHLGTGSFRYYTGPEAIYYKKPSYGFASLRIQNGVSFQSKKHINFTLHTSMGAKKITASNNESIKKGEISYSWGLYFYLGYRF